MRWKINPAPKAGDKRQIRKFIWKPLAILNELTGEYDVRWLELVVIEQLFDGKEWLDVRFVDFGSYGGH
jgi:hypothetical protein